MRKVFVLILTALTLASAASAKPTDMPVPDGAVRTWATDASKVIRMEGKVWLTVAPKADGTVHADGARTLWAG